MLGLTKVRREHPTATNTSSTAAATHSSRRITRSLRLQRLAELGLPARAVIDLSLQLAAGGIDVVAAGPPNGRQHIPRLQHLLESADVTVGRALEARTRKWIEGDEIYLGGILHLRRIAELPHEARKSRGMLWLVVDALHHGVLEGDRRAGLARDIALAGRHQF